MKYIEFDVPGELLNDRWHTIFTKELIKTLVEDWAEQHKIDKFKIPLISWNRVKLYNEQHYTLFALSFPNSTDLPYTIVK